MDSFRQVLSDEPEDSFGKISGTHRTWTLNTLLQPFKLYLNGVVLHNLIQRNLIIF